jgi:hypothetical protein
MNSILPAIISGLIGTIISVCVTVFLFYKQYHSETNRVYLKSMFDTMKKMYVHLQKNEEITDELAFDLLSLKVIGLKKFEKLKEIVDELNKLVSDYNSGVKEALGSTVNAGQITQKGDLEKN